MSTIQTRNKIDNKIHENQFYCVANAHSFMQRPVHLSFGRVKTYVDGSNMDGRVVESECKWCHMCVCSPFQPHQMIRHI